MINAKSRLGKHKKRHIHSLFSAFRHPGAKSPGKFFPGATLGNGFFSILLAHPG